MKKIHFIGFVMAVCLAVCSVARGDEALKLLTIGNSFSESLTRQLPKVVKSAGKKLDHLDLYRGGCSLKQHWENRENPKWYSKKITLIDALKMKKWDVVTLQQLSSSANDAASYEPYFGQLVALIKELAPSAEIVIHQTWSWPRKDMSVDAFYEGVRGTYAGMAEKYGIKRTIPSGYAIQVYRHVYEGDALAKDHRHLSKPAGEYLQSLVWAGKLFDVDPKTIAYAPEGVDEKMATAMRDSAARALASTTLKD